MSEIAYIDNEGRPFYAKSNRDMLRDLAFWLVRAIVGRRPVMANVDCYGRVALPAGSVGAVWGCTFYPASEPAPSGVESAEMFDMIIGAIREGHTQRMIASTISFGEEGGEDVDEIHIGD